MVTERMMILIIKDKRRLVPVHAAGDDKQDEGTQRPIRKKRAYVGQKLLLIRF